METTLVRHVPYGQTFLFKSLIQYLEGGVQSRALVQEENFSVTLFSFAKDEGITEYEMQGETWIFVNEGSIEVMIEDRRYVLGVNDSIAVPLGKLLSIDAVERSKMTMIIVK